MEWDLYVDESGKFETKGEHTLIGGFILPHKNGSAENLFDSWCREVREKVVAKGLYTEEELKRGDEVIKSGIESEEKFYAFSHCMKNKKNETKWKTQKFILGEFNQRIRQAGGRLVVFDNPNGKYSIDSNTTFMTVFANGFMRLYNMLKAVKKENIVVNINAAARKNITRIIEADKAAVSPMLGNEGILEKKLYLNQICNLVFLHGGHQLLELNSFKKSLDSFKLMYDGKNAKGEKVPNSATTICDYICNSMYNLSRHDEFKEYYTDENAYVFDVFDDNLIMTEFEQELLEQNNAWGSILINLISENFPVAKTEDFFEKLNARRYDQSLCVKAVVYHMYTFVENRENIDEMIERIETIIEKCLPMNSSAYMELKANMLIYLIALYTHIGKQEKVTEAGKELLKVLGGITDMWKRDELIILFLNRQIVSYTDMFEFDKAEKCYEILKTYWEEYDSVSENLLIGLAEINVDESIISESSSVQLGRCTGSYIQIKTKQARVYGTTPDESFEENVKNISYKAFKGQPRDVARFEQNMADYYTEQGEFDKALECLCKAINAENTDNFENNANAVLEETGRYGEKDRFVYLHYVYLMHRCIRIGDERGMTMLNMIDNVALSPDKFEHLMNEAHPGGVILWHLAACMAMSGKSDSLSKNLFETAYRLLSNNKEDGIFAAIAIAIKAEQIACALSGKQPGKEEKWQKYAKEFDKELESFKGCGRFEEILRGRLEKYKKEDTVARYFAVADAIPY